MTVHSHFFYHAIREEREIQREVCGKWNAHKALVVPGKDSENHVLKKGPIKEVSSVSGLSGRIHADPSGILGAKVAACKELQAQQVGADVGIEIPAFSTDCDEMLEITDACVSYVRVPARLNPPVQPPSALPSVASKIFSASPLHPIMEKRDGSGVDNPAGGQPPQKPRVPKNDLPELLGREPAALRRFVRIKKVFRIGKKCNSIAQGNLAV